MKDTPLADKIEEGASSLSLVESTALLADLWWLEYQDAAEEARDALRTGDKMQALALAIWAHKIKVKYEYYANRLGLDRLLALSARSSNSGSKK